MTKKQQTYLISSLVKIPNTKIVVIYNTEAAQLFSPIPIHAMTKLTSLYNAGETRNLIIS